MWQWDNWLTVERDDEQLGWWCDDIDGDELTVEPATNPGDRESQFQV